MRIEWQQGINGEVDWADTPLFTMYKRYGRWNFTHNEDDDGYYSEAECKMLYSHFKKVSISSINYRILVTNYDKIIILISSVFLALSNETNFLKQVS